MSFMVLWKRGVATSGFSDWFSAVRFATEEALDEIYRVLKEGAVFGMIWNIDDCETSQAQVP